MQDEIAASLDATPELLPYLPELLRDLFAIGCDPGGILDLVRPLRLDPGSRVLDLACGKGAAGLTLARELGLTVRAVDAFEPFVVEARRRAAEWGVASRCTFEVGDLGEVVAVGDDADVVIYASVGVLGAHDRCVGELRRCVRAGGYIVIDDGFLIDVEGEGEVDPAYAHYAGHNETLRRLTAHGDVLVAETLAPRDEAAAKNREITEAIRCRAEDLARMHPEDAALLRGYVERQKEECATLERRFQPAIWILRKGSLGPDKPVS